MHLKKQRLSALFIFSILIGMIVSSLLVAAEKAASPDDVLAEVGAIKITRAMFEKELETFLANASPQAAAHFNTPEGKKTFLRQIAEIYALEAKADQLGLKKGNEFETSVHEISVSRLAQQKMQQAMDQINISEDEAKKHYETNKDNYTESPSYHLFQISVKSPEKAVEVKKELEAGKSFLEIAKKESIDDYKDAGGDRGFVSESAISPAVLQAIRQLKKDEVSAPVRADKDTYLIVKFTEKKEGTIKPFDNVSAQIARELESSRQREVFEQQIADLKKELAFELNDKALELLKKESLSDEEKNQVLFKYAGKEVKVEELYQELAQIPPFLRPQILNGQGLDDFLNNFIARKLAIESAEKNFDKLAKEFPDIIEDSGKRIAIKALLDRKLGEITVDEKEIEEFYNKNLAQFSEPMQISAHHILVKNEADAKKILEELKDDPSRFEAIAKEKSECPSGKSAGGDLGQFSEGQMVAEFDKACKEAEIGKIFGPVKTQFGYHIIRVDKRTPAGTRKLEEVKDQIKNKLLPEKQKEAFTKLVDEIKKELKVVIYEDKL
ncbi:MAG: hypothetical protein Kow0029_10500 [Candidatus Rifleibacteriota bacterium]